MTASRKALLMATLLVAGSALAAGNESAGETSDEAQSTASATGERLQRESAEALDALQAYTAEQKQQAGATAQELINRLETRIQRLRTGLNEQWDELDKAAREQQQAAIDELARRRDQLKDTYKQLQSNSGSAWQELKGGFVRSYRELIGGDQDAGAQAVQGAGNDGKQGE